jgi:hypothetical protein
MCRISESGAVLERQQVGIMIESEIKQMVPMGAVEDH